MKTCPTCKRGYEDDTLFFCLEDGSNLSAVYIPSGSSQRNEYPPPTEILPVGAISLGPPAIKVDAGSPPLTHPQQPTTNQTTASSNSGMWIVVGGILAGIVVLLIGVAGYFAWRASRPSSTEPTQAQSSSTSSTPTNSRVQAQPVAAPTSEATVTPNWLDGVWEGEGYQTDTNTTWSVRLTIRNNNFSVEYKDIPCSGSWKIVDENSSGGTFTEIITKGTDLCVNKSRILLQKVSDTELSLKYSHENTRTVVATATLRKKVAKE